MCAVTKPRGAEVRTTYRPYVSIPGALFPWLANFYSSFKGPAPLSSLQSLLLWPLVNIPTTQVMVMLLPRNFPRLSPVRAEAILAPLHL